MNQIIATPEFWRKCSSCKNAIGYRSKHYVCSVSTCTRKRVGYVFCSVHCWERHLPGARHRDAAAIEEISPTFEQWKAELASESPAISTPNSSLSSSSPSSSTSNTPAQNSPQKFIVRSSTPSVARAAEESLERETLVVVSKVKAYIREKSEMNTSDAVMELLSRKLRRICDQAIDKAREAGRKTVMERDFE